MMRRRLRRTTAIAAASVVLVFWVVPSSKAGAFLSRLTDAAAPATNAVSLNGEGSDDLEAEIPGWSSELYGTSKKLAMTYAVVGGPEGAFDYSTGLGNFLVSGTPLTTSQLAQIPSSYGSLISAPIMVSALGLAVSWGPAYTLNRSCSSGQTDCQATSKYTGPLDLPANDIADMLLSNTDPSTCGCLSDASILNATDSQLSQGDDASSPTVSDNTPETTHILALLRSDPSESGYYLQEYLSQAAPSEFSHVPGFQPPITPFLQGTSDSQYDVSYDGESAMDGYMTNEGGSVVGHDLQGVLSMLSASGLYRQTYYLPPNIPPLSFTPAYEPAWTGIENALGQYVTPTPESIDAAVNAGGATPLYALTHQVAGAYPLTYVNNIYVQSKGLTPDQAEATASMIRYVATAGQDLTAQYNDGRLTPTMTQQALAAANQIIASNCTGSGDQLVVSSDFGRYAPTLTAAGGKSVPQRQAELSSIGSMLHCENAVSAPTKSATSPTTVGSSGSTPPTIPETVTTIAIPVSTGSGSTGTGATAVPSASASVPNLEPGAKNSRLESRSSSARSSPPTTTGPITLANLPLPLPGTGSGRLNQLFGMVLGGMLFLGLWRYRAAIGKVFGA